jgi:hypothetical protein
MNKEFTINFEIRFQDFFDCTRMIATSHTPLLLVSRMSKYIKTKNIKFKTMCAKYLKQMYQQNKNECIKTIFQAMFHTYCTVYSVLSKDWFELDLCLSVQ